MIASHQLMQTAVVADANSIDGAPFVVIETLQPCSYQQPLLLLSYMEAAMCLGAHAAGGGVVVLRHSVDVGDLHHPIRPSCRGCWSRWILLVSWQRSSSGLHGAAVEQ
jgi:hypothetical protein